ncbi:MAG: cytochrome P450 [Acidimicrobiales bacterium]
MEGTQGPPPERLDEQGARPVADFDHHDPEFHQHRHERWAELRRCPVAFNPRYGGFWVVSGHDEVAQVSRDGDTFTSRYERTSPDGVDYLGITGIPRLRGIPPAGIAEVEGPRHQALRRLINPYMLPLAVERLRPFIEAVTTWFIDRHIEAGHADLVLDVTNPVPAVLTMKTLGLPCDQWEHYANLFHATVALRPGDPAYDRAMANVPTMIGGLLDEANSRRTAPQPDLLTDLVNLEVEGRRLSDEDLTAVLWNLVGGGLDTTTSLTSLALHHLDAHPDLRRRLIEQPELLPSATEEFLRFFSVNETLTRTVTRDVELGGQVLRRGDHVLVSWLSANHDERAFSDAGTVVLDRAPNHHLAFGVGPHRCIGMHLARTMFQVLVTEVLRRMPDYRVDHDATRFYQGNPTLNGVVRMPVTFTPGAVAGPPARPF